MKTQKKPYWNRAPLNIVSVERLLSRLDAGEEPWRLFSDDKLFRRLEVCDYANEYAEPGYSLEGDQKAILFGNWNYVSKAGYDLLETRFALEWCDEWSTCSDCGKAVRTNADSCCGSPAYVVGDGELLCCECVGCDPDSYFSRVSWSDHYGRPEESPSYTLLRHCGVYSGEPLPDGWERLSNLEDTFRGDEKRAVEHYLAEGYERVLVYYSGGYDLLILGYREEEDEE